MKASIIALGALGALVACKSHTEEPTPSGMPVLKGPKTPIDAAAGSAIAGDAAVAVAPAIDAAPGIAIPTKQPAFGCIASTKDAVACIVGSRMIGGASDVTLVVAPGTTKIVIDHRGDMDAATADMLPPGLVTKLGEVLAGFQPIDHAPPSVAWERADRTLRPGPARTTGAWTIDAKLKYNGKSDMVPKYSLNVDAHLGKAAPLPIVAIADDAISDARVHAFAIGERVVVEVTWSTGEEGAYTSNGTAWLCDATTCKDIAN